MTDADPLVRTLAAIVAELTFVLEDVIGDDGEPRAALNTLEWVSFVLGELGPDQRRRLADVIADIPDSADVGPRREFLDAFADNFDLLPDQQ